MSLFIKTNITKKQAIHSFHTNFQEPALHSIRSKSISKIVPATMMVMLKMGTNGIKYGVY
jgi:hypothetical protein